MARCAICKFKVGPDDDTTRCPGCGALYHSECWQQIGGCAVYGCRRVPKVEKQVPQQVTGGWGDVKQCPACSKTIVSSLLKCTCGATFPYAEPMTSSEYDEWLEKEKARKRKESQLLWLFIVSLFALPAPITGAIAAWQSHRNYELLIGAGGAYLALGYGTALIGFLYSLIFLALVTGF